MMFNSIREQRFIRSKVRKDPETIYSGLESHRAQSKTLVICPTPTGSNWSGVSHATHSLFPSDTFSFPQYYSRTVYSEKELLAIAKKISDLSFEWVVFSGFPEYFRALICNIHSTKISSIFHGALSEVGEKNCSLRTVLSLVGAGKIQRVGFVKKGLAEYFSQTLHLQCFYLPLLTRIPENLTEIYPEPGLHIGVFGNNSFNKNIHNQVAAALLIPGANIHVLGKDDFTYLQVHKRIVHHKQMSRPEFISLLGSMTINLHISFSESWGQIVTESLAMGVPCLTSNNNGIFDYDDFLANELIVYNYDNPWLIAKQISNVLLKHDEISQQGYEYIKILNNIAEEKLQEFIHT